MVVLFPTCLGDAVAPSAVRDAAAVLRAAGVEPVAPRGAACCGQPAWNSGFTADARRVARTTLRALAACRRRGGAGRLVRGDDAAALAGAVRGRRAQAGPQRWRAACSSCRSTWWTSWGSRRSGRPAISPWPTTTRATCCASCASTISPAPCCGRSPTLVELPRSDRCCGFGGTFSVRYPEVSTAMADDKLAAATAAGIELIASADPGLCDAARRTGVAYRRARWRSSIWQPCWRGRCEQLHRARARAAGRSDAAQRAGRDDRSPVGRPGARTTDDIAGLRRAARPGGGDSRRGHPAPASLPGRAGCELSSETE